MKLKATDMLHHSSHGHISDIHIQHKWEHCYFTGIIYEPPLIIPTKESVILQLCD